MIGDNFYIHKFGPKEFSVVIPIQFVVKRNSGNEKWKSYIMNYYEIGYRDEWGYDDIAPYRKLSTTKDIKEELAGGYRTFFMRLFK